MKRATALILLASCASLSPVPPGPMGAEAPEAWTGSESDVRQTIEVLASTGLGTIRVFIRESFTQCKDVESPLNVWHDEILDRIDFLLHHAENAGRLVIVVIHDGRNRRDGYASDITSTTGRAAFRRRIKHVLDYVGLHTRRPWKTLPPSLVWWQVQSHGDWRSALDWNEDMAGYIKMLAPQSRVVAELDHVTFGGLAGEMVAASSSVDVWGYPFDGAEPLELAADALNRATKSARREWMLLEVGGLRSRPERVRQMLEQAAKVASKHGVRWLFSSLGRDRHEASTDLWPGDVVFDSVIAPMARAR